MALAPLKIDPADLAQLKTLEAAAAAVAAQPAALAAYRAEINVKYGINPGDAIADDGTITRHPIGASGPFGPFGHRPA